MKLKFVDQDFQTDAVNAIADIFEGTETKDSEFTIDKSKGLDNKSLGVQGRGISYELGYGNKLLLDSTELLNNVRYIQEKNNILKTNSLHDMNFSVEMETGTGKTYVYTKTILELNKRYGFTKFIVVVPSIAIKEGVYKSFQVTEEHFKAKYDNVPYNYFVYDSSKLNRIMTYSMSTNIEIMIINIDAFRKTLREKNKGNIIHRESDRLSGNKPIDLIAGTSPVVIIDEPQSVDNTPKAKEAMSTLNPLVTLRYSATHKEEYNLMYRLTPVDAYQKRLVKQIEVSSVQSDEVTAKPYIKLISVSDNNGYSAKIEIFKKKKSDGTLSKKKVTAKPGDDLWELSNGVDYYENQNYRVEDIDCFEDDESITFAEGTMLHIGEGIGEASLEAMRRAQIRETIDLHLHKEKHYLDKGIKVLSLFFIDKVANYRIHNDDGSTPNGKYAVWFEEEYKRLINGKYKHLKEKYPSHFEYEPEDIHSGYFSKDKKGRLKDTKGDTIADDSTYELIMKDKERLLDMNEPLRFIFSHSALKEGWDNPNVFQVCTLVETKDTMTKRQKIGRGLRICVDQEGSRVNDEKYNVLSVIANESYKDFAKQLQSEMEKEAGYKFGVVEQLSFTDVEITEPDGTELKLTQEQSKELYKHLKDSDYLNSRNKVTEKFYKAVNNDEASLELPDKFEPFKKKIEKRMLALSKDIEIKNRNERVEVKRNKKVYLSDTFIKAFDKIKQKTFYSVNIDIEDFVYNTVEAITRMDQVESEKVRRERSKLNITEGGVVNDESIRYQAVGDIYEFEKPRYPDLIRRLQDSTGLLRSTVIDMLKRSGRIDEFNINPEVFIRQVSKIINAKKREYMIDGIMYHKTDDYYVMSEIFDDTELYGYQDDNVLDISSEKNVYDHVIFDSIIEKEFAEDAEEDEDVEVYAKLPLKFKIDTPYGNYSPDWLVVIQSESERKLYFVAETKGSQEEKNLRGAEKAKILSGRKHFEVLDTGVKYEMVKALKELKS